MKSARIIIIARQYRRHVRFTEIVKRASHRHHGSEDVRQIALPAIFTPAGRGDAPRKMAARQVIAREIGRQRVEIISARKSIEEVSYHQPPAK